MVFEAKTEVEVFVPYHFMPTPLTIKLSIVASEAFSTQIPWVLIPVGVV